VLFDLIFYCVTLQEIFLDSDWFAYKTEVIDAIAYNAAIKSKVFSEIIVSTDSAKYQKFLKKKNISIPFLRPKKLAADNVADLEVLKYELRKYEKYFNKNFDYIAMLQPTCPNRTSNDIIKSYKKIRKEKLDSIWTITKVNKKFHPHKILVIKNLFLDYFNSRGSKFVSRQKLDDTYIRNGAVYFFSRMAILKFKNIKPKKTGYIVINRPLVNIDDIADLEYAKNLLGNKKI
jgi:CMP-N-acetylneuraminic acid synthetase